MISEVELYFSVDREIPQRVFVFLRSNDIDNVENTADVYRVTQEFLLSKANVFGALGYFIFAMHCLFPY